MAEIVNKIFASIKTHGSLSAFLGGVIEEIIVPIPSPLISMGAGFLLIEPNLPLGKAVFKMISIVSLPFAFGATFGSLLAYSLAFFGGKPVIDRVGRFFDLSWEEIEKAERRFTKGKKDEFLIFISRAIPVVPISLISATCGFLRIPLQEFLLFTFLGIVVRCFILAFLGWRVGEVYHNLAQGLDLVENIISIIFLVVAGAFLGFLYLKREKLKREKVLHSS